MSSLNRQHRQQLIEFLIHLLETFQPLLNQCGIAQGLGFENRDARGVAFTANVVRQCQLVDTLLKLRRFGEGFDFAGELDFLAGDQLVNVGDEVGGGLVQFVAAGQDVLVLGLGLGNEVLVTLERGFQLLEVLAQLDQFGMLLRKFLGGGLLLMHLFQSTSVRHPDRNFPP